MSDGPNLTIFYRPLIASRDVLLSAAPYIGCRYMEMKGEIRVKSKRMAGWIMAFIIIASVGAGGSLGWSSLSKEHDEAGHLPLNGADFSKLNDGTYIGEYEGGMYKWRANKAQVLVTSGKVKHIELVSSSDPGAKNTDQASLFDRVIEAQSLQVDTISGATLTSKAYLKAVENALIKAQKR